MGLLATALACLAVYPGCGGPAVEAPPSVAAFQLSYERSGGLKPDPRSLQIEPGRRATAQRRKLSARSDSRFTARFRLGIKQVKRLRNALERADFQAIPGPTPLPSNCADCYLYEIEYRGHTVSFDQTTVPEGLEPVVDQAEALIEAHLPFH
jgi:hypothetical protein